MDSTLDKDWEASLDWEVLHQMSSICKEMDVHDYSKLYHDLIRRKNMMIQLRKITKD